MPHLFDVVFRGGGIKGAAFVGALEVLDSAGHQVRRRIGSSVGAIFATCHACGYTAGEMNEELTKTTSAGRPLFSSFLAPAGDHGGLDGHFIRIAGAAIDRAASYIPNVSSDQTAGLGSKTLGLTFEAAACSDTPLREWIAARLDAKKVNPAITLAAFQTHIAKKSPSQLSLVAADITEKECLLFNERTAPKLPLLEAIRMSVGIPFVWPPVEWKAAWGTYRRSPNREVDLQGHLIVDGGLLSNFPIRYLVEPRHTAADGQLGPIAGPAARPLGLLLSEAEPVPDFPQRPRRPLIDQLPMVRVGSLLLDTVLDAGDADVMRALVSASDDVKMICRIGTQNFSSLEFDLPYEAPPNGRGLKQLVNSGRDAMTRFLTRLS